MAVLETSARKLNFIDLSFPVTETVRLRSWWTYRWLLRMKSTTGFGSLRDTGK
jgi:hypothetical protein